MTKLFLTRHGQTEWNLEGRLQGHKDSNLTDVGEQQAKLLGERLKDIEIDVIISSSSGRAYRTAELICGDREIDILPNDNLKEINIGDWEGQLVVEVEEHSPDEHHNFWNLPHLYQPSGGETFQQLHTRVSNEIEKIITEHYGKNILVVTHGVVLKALISYFENKEIKDLWSGAFMHSTCLNIVEIDNKERRFLLQGDISHYSSDESI
ncbi:histidine phosphatase family protein [Alkaliphilus peptidifermentans]|uniref:Phosphoglycerate mutase n=1 Tax=Alkaliphilus peptidifermentans DSM 18978 TaxID=1120976 RepID=A0A1G5GYW5_9FIRM|nr:histidine phosphatase family protein [Alkaliphilus peptidifermentans]SCY56726.1 phosphoglycerate mutase [Alkaliphilus peptidifermentans DSM 18978]